MLFLSSRRSVRALGEGGLHESPSSRSVERRRVGVERGTARGCWLVPLHRHQLARNRLRSSITHCARWVRVYSLIFLGNTLYSITCIFSLHDRAAHNRSRSPDQAGVRGRPRRADVYVKQRPTSEIQLVEGGRSSASVRQHCTTTSNLRTFNILMFTFQRLRSERGNLNDRQPAGVRRWRVHLYCHKRQRQFARSYCRADQKYVPNVNFLHNFTVN